MPESKPTLFQRINAIRNEVKYLKKDLTINKQYQAVSHDAVTSALRPFLVKHGVLVLPNEICEAPTMVPVGATRSGATMFRYESRYEVSLVDVDSGDGHAFCVNAHALDEGDKAPGKAMSYAVKYVLLKVFSLETGENEESRLEMAEKVKKISGEQATELEDMLKRCKDPARARIGFLKRFKVGDTSDINVAGFQDAVNAIRSKLKAEGWQEDKKGE